MSRTAKVYITTVAALGGLVLAVELCTWQSQDFIRYLCYLVVAIFSSRLKVKLPGITGTMSVFFIFILFGVVQFSGPETVVLGCLAALAQCYWHSGTRPKFHQALFNVGAVAIAVATTVLAYHSQFIYGRHVDSALMMVAAATVFFVMNTFPVAAVVVLTEGGSFRRVWHEFYFWSFT